MPIPYDSDRFVLWNHCYKSKHKNYKQNQTCKEARCYFCVNAYVQKQFAEQQQQVAAGQRSDTDSEEALLERVLTCEHDIPGVRILCARPEYAHNHLAEHCGMVTADAKRWAEGQQCARRAKRGRAALEKAQPAPGRENIPPTGTLSAQSSSMSLASSASENANPARARLGNVSNSSNTRSELDPQLGPGPPPTQRLRHDDAELRGGPMQFSTPIAPSDVPDALPIPFRGEVPPITHHPLVNAEFAADLCRLILACNMAWWSVENPFFTAFMQKWIPGILVPGRRQLSGRILDDEADAVTKAICEEVRHKHATGACDGWKNVKKDSLLASTANAEGRPVLLNVHDISDQPKTADNLLEIVEKEMKYMLEVLCVWLVAWCTDASGESAKMRRMLVARHPWLVVLDCWAHQVQLVVGDLFRVQIPWVQVIDRATELVKWFNNHSFALGLLKAEQKARSPGKVLALILPGTTRWTSHFLCVSRLLDVEGSIRYLPIDPVRKEQLLRAAGPKREAKAKAQAVVATVLDDEFWEQLRRLRDLLRPLAIASNVTQADTARLDTVLLTLGYLYHVYSTQSLEPPVRDALLASLEKRWANADRPIFILSVAFNPYIRTDAFNPHGKYKTVGSLKPLVRDAFLRFYNVQPDYEMMGAFTDYVSRQGEWSDEAMDLQNVRELARAQHVGVNLVQLWKDNDTGLSNGRNGIVKLAMRILSMVPNSAATERCFSVFRAIHTDHRNRMHPEKVRRMAIVNADTQRRYGAPPQPRLKRKFGDDDGQQGALATTPAVPMSTPETSSRPGSPPIDPALRENDDEDDEFPTLTQLLQHDQTPEENGSGLDVEEALKLKNLFIYPSQSCPASQSAPTSQSSPATITSLGYMLDFWRRGEEGLSAEEGYYDACTSAADLVDPEVAV